MACIRNTKKDYWSTHAILYITLWKQAEYTQMADGTALSLQQFATGWMVQGSNFGECKPFRTHLPSAKPQAQPRFLYNEHCISFLEAKWPGLSVNNQPPPSVEVSVWVELYLHLPQHLQGMLQCDTYT